MKSVIISLVVLLSLSACTQQKTAYINSEELMKGYEVMKEYEKTLEQKEAEFKLKYEGQIEAIQKEYQEFQQKAAKMDRKKADARNMELTQRYQQLQQIQQAESYQLQQESQTGMGEILKEALDFVSDYGKKNGYTYIFGSSKVSGTILYGDEKLDITEQVIEALNNKSDVKEDNTKTPAVKEETSEEKKVEETQDNTPNK